MTINEENEKKKELCFNLSKDLKKGEIQIEKYEDIIQLNKDEDIQAELKDIEISSIFGLTFICLGPIISLFINIVKQMWDILIINSIVAIIATIILTLNVRSYIYWYKNEKKIVKEKTKQSIFLILILMVFLILFFFLSIILSTMIEYFIAPKGWLFYEFQSPQILVIVLIFCPILYLLNLIGKIKSKEAFILKENINIKVLVPCFIIWLMGMYICFTSVTFVTENTVVCYSPLNLAGKEYNFNEISKVEAKFGNKTFALNSYERKGNFQYTIYLDGKKIVFYAPTPNSNIERYMDGNNTYLELEEFDAKLMQLNITKESNEANHENCDMDQIYVDRFLIIIRNK